MTERKLKTVRPRLEALIAQDRDLLKALVKEALEQILQAEMTDFLGAAPGERVATRGGYRERGLVTRGATSLRVPRDRSREVSTALFDVFTSKRVATTASSQFRNKTSKGQGEVVDRFGADPEDKG